MIHKTRGIVLHNTRFSESSVVTKIYTREMGMQSYMINSVRKGKGSIRPSHLMPLNLLDMVVYHKEGHGLQRIRELRCEPPLNDLPFDVVKNSIGLFISELLNQTLDGDDANGELFDFTESFICLLDMEKEHLANHPLWFMVQLSRYLGFLPEKIEISEGTVFNLEDGEFTSAGMATATCMTTENTGYFSDLLKTPLEGLHGLKIPRESRSVLLDNLVMFYKIHVLHGRNLRSHEVLKTVFR